MSKFNKYVIIFMALLIACMSVAVAADVDDTADISSDVADNVEADSTATANLQAVSNVNEDNNLVKESKSIKQNTVINVNSEEDFDNLFDVVSTGVNQIKSENSGKTISINTDITKNDNSYIINVPITLTSNDNKTINLNTYNSYESGVTEHWTALNFTTDASGSRINNIQFTNSQVFVLAADDIIFDQITVNANQPYGKGTGLFAIRESSTNIDVTNSYFNINNNGGISVIALTNAEDCLIDHNTITATGSVGNLIYLNTYFYNTNPAPQVTNRHNTISYNTLTGPTTPVNTCFAIAIAGPDNTISHNTINYAGTGITTNWQGSYDTEIIELNENDFITTYEGNKYYYNTLNNGASFTCGNYSIVENNYITGKSTFSGHSNVTSNTLLNTITVHNNVRFHSNTATGQTVNVKKANSCFKDNVIGLLNFTLNKARYTYDCGGNTFGSTPNYPLYFISCNGNCPNCAQTSNTLSFPNSTKIIKKDSDIVYSDDELIIYQNGTAILTITNATHTRYLTAGNTNSHLNDVENLNNIIIYVNGYVSYVSVEQFDINLGANKENIDLKIVWNTSRNIASQFTFDCLGYKSITYENCKFYIKNDDEGTAQWAFYNNTHFINCNFQYLVTAFAGPNSGGYYTTELLYPTPWGLHDAGQTENIMTIVGENISFKQCIFDLKTTVPYIDPDFTIENYYTNVIVFEKSKNVLFDNNTFQISTYETDSSIDPTMYGPLLNRTVNNLTFINNDVTVRYSRGIMLKTNNSLFENNTIYVTNTDTTIELTGDNNIVRYNTLTSQSAEGDATVVVNGSNNIVKQNPYVEIVEPVLKVDATEFTTGQTATIQASIYLGEDVATNISKGKVSFKVNGKTLKDTNGKVIYAKVTNGTATIYNYQIPESWKEGSTIQAIYSGSKDMAKTSSEKTEITLTKPEPTLTTEEISSTVASTVTLKATVNTTVPVNIGKVVFKINGKSLKDTNGKVIYAKVVNNTVSVEYTLPEGYKEGTYNITAVFISPDNGRLEDTKTLTVTA